MDESVKKSGWKKVGGIALNVLTYLFLGICILAVVISVSAKKDVDGTVNLFGKQMRVVTTNSMEKCAQTDVSDYKIKDIPVKSLIFIELVPESEEKAQAWYAKLEKGDVLTFRYVYVRQETITHRIKEITAKKDGSGYVIELEGDNKASDGNTLAQTIDTSLSDSPNYVLGKVTKVSHGLGVLLTALKSPVGMVFMVIVPSLLIMGFEIFRLVSLLTEKKRLAAKEKEEAQTKEMEALKKQLALLQEKEMQREKKEVTEDERKNDGSAFVDGGVSG